MAVDIDAETRLIRDVWDESVVALTTKNWEAYSRFWAHEPNMQVIHPAERYWTRGWEAVEIKIPGCCGVARDVVGDDAQV